jgi:hypothetical protein
MFYPSDKKLKSINDEYQYFGSGLSLGECGIKLKLTAADAGEWKCGIGQVSVLTMEATKSFDLKLSNSAMMAVAKSIEVFPDNHLVIECISIPKKSPLDLCRFITPRGIAFAIDERITVDNPLAGNYYFDPNRRISQGYCTVIVKNPRRGEHAGTWTCIGMEKDERSTNQDVLHDDKIYVYFDNGGGVVNASLVGSLTGLLVIGFLVLSVFGYKVMKNRGAFSNTNFNLGDMINRVRAGSRRRIRESISVAQPVTSDAPTQPQEQASSDLMVIDDSIELTEQSVSVESLRELRESSTGSNHQTTINIAPQSSSTL